MCHSSCHQTPKSSTGFHKMTSWLTTVRKCSYRILATIACTSQLSMVYLWFAFLCLETSSVTAFRLNLSASCSSNWDQEHVRRRNLPEGSTGSEHTEVCWQHNLARYKPCTGKKKRVQEFGDIKWMIPTHQFKEGQLDIFTVGPLGENFVAIIV